MTPRIEIESTGVQRLRLRRWCTESIYNSLVIELPSTSPCDLNPNATITDYSICGLYYL